MHALRFLEQAFETPFRMFEAMAAFYEKNGYFVNSPARSYRYQVLLEFAREYDSSCEVVYRELLTYDMYLRENLKSRPDFARDLQEYKEEIREFYRQEEENRKFLPSYVNYDSRQLARMTHLEPFYYPVWDIKPQEAASIREKVMGEGENAGSLPTYVLFDYHKRSPLTMEARVVKVRGEE